MTGLANRTEKATTAETQSSVPIDVVINWNFCVPLGRKTVRPDHKIIRHRLNEAGMTFHARIVP